MANLSNLGGDMGQGRVLCLALLLAVGLGGGCRQEPSAEGPRYGAVSTVPSNHLYTLAVYPLNNPAKLFQAYQPLCDYLSREMPGARFELEASRDYAHFEEKIRARSPEFLLANPWQTRIAMPLGYQVIVMAGEPGDGKGLFIARKDSQLRVPPDLKGQAVSYPSPTAFAACILAQDFLQRRGVKVMQDIDNRYVGSQESSIMNAYLGKTAVGVTRPSSWRRFQREHPREAALLKVLWETEPLVNNSLMVRNDVPEAVQRQVVVLLLHLGDDQPGAKILAGMDMARFLSASNADYDFLRQYLAKFAKEVRPVK